MKWILQLLEGLRAAIKDHPDFSSSVVGNFIVTLVGIGLRFVGGVMIARALGPTPYGQYAAFILYVETARAISLMGLNVPVVRYVALNKAHEDWALIRGVLTRFSQFILISSTIGAISLFSYIAAFDPIALNGVDKMHIAMGMLIIFFGNIESVRVAILAGFGRVGPSKIPDSVIRPLVIIAGATYLISRAGSGVSVEELITLSLVAATLGLVAGYLSLTILLPKTLWRARPVFKSRTWLRDSMPFVGIGILYPLSAQLDGLILSVLARPEELAHFAIAKLLVSVVSLPFAVILPVVYPRLVQRFGANDTAGVTRLSGYVAYFSIAAALPVSIVFYFFGDWVVSTIFGPEFRSAAAPLAILSVSNLLLIPMLIAPQLFSALGHAKILVNRLPLAIALGSMLNFILIPQFGASGAALAMSISLIAYNGWLTYSCNTKLGINWMPLTWLKTVRA